MFENLMAIQIAAACGVLVVLALRLLVRRLCGPRIAFALWALPLIGALAVLLPGPVQPVDLAQPGEISGPALSAEVSPDPASARPVEDLALPALMPVQQRAFAMPAIFADPALWIALWALGGVVMGGVLIARQIRYFQRLRPMVAAPELGPDVYRAGACDVGAGLVGAARPRIVVPADFEDRFSKAEQALILAHEREHRRAGHAQFNAIAAVLQIVCWLNPVVHVGLRWFRLDQELACDAAILASSANSARTYGTALLRAQTEVAAPFGCTWRPANGLTTRIKALGNTAPASLQRALGAVGIIALVLGLGTASWAARPEVQGQPGATMIVEPVPSNTSRVRLDGVNGTVRILFEARDSIAFEGYESALTGQHSGSEIAFSMGPAGPDLCNGVTPPTHDFTLRVPNGVLVDVSGRMQADISAPQGARLNLEGCGDVGIGDVAGDLYLSIGQSVAVRGDTLEGALELRGWGSSRAAFTEILGDLRLETEGGVRLDIMEFSGNGRFSLSGGSVLAVERWDGGLVGAVNGGSVLSIEEILADEAEIVVSGGARAFIETGTVGDLRIDQAARAQFSFGGSSQHTRVRNRGESPVVVVRPGEIDLEGRFETVLDPPAD